MEMDGEIVPDLPSNHPASLVMRLRSTALREAFEEVAIRKENLQVLCRLEPSETLRGPVTVLPWVARVEGDYCFSPNPSEVEEIFTVPLAAFLHSQWKCTNNSSQGQSRHRLVEGHPGHFFHEFIYQDGSSRSWRIWGWTAAVAIRVAQIAYGREPEFPFDYPNWIIK